MVQTILAFFFLISTPFIASAHPGRTDAYGCHTCHTNCPNWGLSYGEYHCHTPKALPQPEVAVTSHYGLYGNGYTTRRYADPVYTPSFYYWGKGSTGSTIYEVQELLAQHPSIYPEGLATGYYGNATTRAVRRVQSYYGLPVTGYINDRTFNAIRDELPTSGL
jgi:hypothetical protein